MYNQNITDVLKILNSRISGLNEEEISKSRTSFGENRLKEKKSKSFILRFFSQFLNLMVMILLVAACISLFCAIRNNDFSDYFESFVIFFIVILNALIGVFQEYKSEECLKSLKNSSKWVCKVLRNNNYYEINIEELVVGDIVLLEAGDLVPADIRLIESSDLKCDESSLSGESIPVDKDAKKILKENTALSERENMIFKGTSVTMGRCTGVVVSVGENTELGKIANLINSTKKDLTPLQKSINKIGKVLTYGILVICAIIFIIEIFLAKNGFINSLMTAVALAVAAIPESLPAVITIILAMGVQRLAKRKVIIKQLHAVETLGSCEVICSDKTGTITENKMRVNEIFYDNTNTLNKDNEVFKILIQCMLNCNNCKNNSGKLIGEPTEKALMEYALNFNNNIQNRIKEIPFDSNRKCMTTINQSDGKLISFTKGAYDILIKKCNKIVTNSGVFDLTDNLRKKINDANTTMAKKALRVMAFAYNNDTVDSENNMTFIGLVGIIDRPKKEVYSAIKKCKKAKIKPVMITGDHKLTAFAIAKDIGIATTESEVITGEEIDNMSEEEFNKKVNNFTVFARVTPEHKVKIVKALKGLKKIVAMTGDGVNDAPSLKMASIGVGMGKSGTDVVKNIADLLVMDDNFSSIIVAVEEGRIVYNNIQKTLQYLISTNTVEVFGVLLALIFFPGAVFLSASQMLYINLITDSLPAFALGMEKAEPDIMERPPRKSSSNIMGGITGFATIYQSILQCSIVLIVFVCAIKFYNPSVASTMVFFTIIFMQLLHSVNAKSNKSIFDRKLLDNKTFNLCFLIILLLNFIVCVLPFSYTLFSMSKLNLQQWIFVIIASFSIIPLCEIVKLFKKEKSY